MMDTVRRRQRLLGEQRFATYMAGNSTLAVAVVKGKIELDHRYESVAIC
jgi:hypothetical protein